MLRWLCFYGCAVLSGIVVLLLALSPISAATAMPAGPFGDAEVIREIGFLQPVSPPPPFGLPVLTLTEGGLFAKWQDARAAISADRATIASCAENRATCGSNTLRLLSIAERGKQKSGLGRLGEINRAINLAIRPVSDQTQYGVEDFWASPLATFASGAGDCEDYAIAKFLALQLAGVPASDLRIVILRSHSIEDHAVLAARLDARWYLLDNRHMALVEDTEVVKERPVFALDNQGVQRFRDAVIAVAEIYMDATSANGIPATNPVPKGGAQFASAADGQSVPSALTEPASQSD